MRLDPRFYMSLSRNEQPEKGIQISQTDDMVLSDENELPTKVANVSREELRRYAQCKQVGNYLLGRTVGEGSFAKVKEAIHILTGEKVAIKIIDKNRARKDRYVSKNMRREARLLQMIRHPHIVQLLEIVETSQCYYLVFEFADGGDLMDHICKRRKLDEDEVRKFTRQIISAVEYLHRLGIMHRDLKVENLLLDANKNIKIIDFGLSNTIYSPEPNSENHCTTQCGSPAYAAPELLVRKDYGPQIDVWSIGVNLYAMLTGRLPYTVEPFNISTLYNKMLRRQMNGIPEYLSEACKDMIHQLLNPDPKQRLHILEAVRHRWITMDQRDPLMLIPCPNYLCEEDLDDRILDHVEEKLKLNSDDVIRDVIQNRATKNSCVYHLLVRRLTRYERYERYEREQRRLISTPPPPTIQIAEEVTPSSLDHKSISSDHHRSSQKNGLVVDKRSSHKAHIMENPFKTIKVALIRQRKAVKNQEKSKHASSGKTSTHNSAHQASSNADPAHKPKLCPIKRVALVKVSPARRSFRGLACGSRNATNSPRPGRRRSYFEGLQQRRKSPKVRRRHAEPDDSSSSTISTRTGKVIDHTHHVKHDTQRTRIENQMNNNRTISNSENSKSSVDNEPRDTTDTNSQKSSTNETLSLENIQEISTPVRDKVPGTNTSETITHLYTDKGVVLKQDSSGENGNHETNYKQEQDTVQHRVFHSSSGDKTVNTGDVKDEQGCRTINGTNSEQSTAGSVLSAVEVVNAKISSGPGKKVETLRPTPHQTLRNQTIKEKRQRLKQSEQKPITTRRTTSKFDSSKIPVLAGKNSAPSRQSALPPSRQAPRTPSHSTTNTRVPGTATRKNDVAKLADKYNKCVSVIVVDRSPDAGKGSSVAGKDSSHDGESSTVVVTDSSNDSKCSKTTEKSSATDESNTKRPAMDVSVKRNGLNGKVERACVPKGSSSIVKEPKERNLKSNDTDAVADTKSGGNNIKDKAEKFERIEEKDKEIKDKSTRQNVQRTRNGLERQKIQDQANRRPSLVKAAKESLAANATRGTTKDSKQTRTGKISTPGNSRPQRTTVTSPQAKDAMSWTGDERRRISSYKKTNDSQQTKPAIKRETKIPASAKTS